MSKTVLKKSPARGGFIAGILVSLATLLWHLPWLTAFPVFADESIYIRWAQLLMDDWHRYLFFPLNDGKTPLFIWLLAPFQSLFADQLFAARFVSVLVGLAQLWVMKGILAKLKVRPTFQVLGMIFTSILPFWYFHAHVALMDGLLTLFLSLTVLGCLQLVEKPHKLPRQLLTIVPTGVAYGLAFWTKLPTLFFLPILPGFALLPTQTSWAKRLRHLVNLVAVALIGGVVFASLRVSPAFGQLFRRGNDFTFPITEVLFHGLWRQTLANIPSYVNYFWVYLTPGIVVFALSGVFSNRARRKVLLCWLAAALFCGPFVLFGKVIYARYLFPAALFITIAAMVSLQAWYEHWFVEHDARLNASKLLWARFGFATLGAILLANSVTLSTQFMGTVLFQPSAIPFISSDRNQYLESWSAGQGIWETAQYIRQQAQTETIAVATEGRFGTLPDGLLLYFHNQNVQNVYIEGTGEYPVKDLPQFFTTRAKSFQQSILVVNSNRMELHLPATQLISQYCRPNTAPCLQIWDITPQVQAAH